MKLDTLCGGKQFDGNNVCDVVEHLVQAARSKRRHAHVIFLISRGRNAVDAGRMRMRLVFRRQCRSGDLCHHETAIEATLFNESFMLTPNIGRLGKQGMVFTRAYCQQAICGPTRNSFLSGRRPQRTKSWNFLDSFREVGPDWVSFPQYFKEHGYAGKSNRYTNKNSG